jgi:hypothetical protein
LITARVAAVISSPDLGVFAVTAAGVLCDFCRMADALSAQCLRRRTSADPLVAAVFRTKWLLRERCSATCLRRRRPGQVRRGQGGLEITAVMIACAAEIGEVGDRADRGDLRAAARVTEGGSCVCSFPFLGAAGWAAVTRVLGPSRAGALRIGGTPTRWRL